MRRSLLLVLALVACKTSSEQTLKQITTSQVQETTNATAKTEATTAAEATEKKATQETKTSEPTVIQRHRKIRIDATPTRPGRTIEDDTTITRGKVVDQKGSQAEAQATVQTAAKGETASQGVKAATVVAELDSDKKKQGAPSLGFGLGVFGVLGLILAALGVAGGIVWRLKPPWLGWLWLLLKRGSGPAAPPPPQNAP